jgi:hypothetical protein
MNRKKIAKLHVNQNKIPKYGIATLIINVKVVQLVMDLLHNQTVRKIVNPLHPLHPLLHPIQQFATLVPFIKIALLNFLLIVLAG